MRKALALLMVLGASALSGCVAALVGAGAGAGYLAHDEATEGDGRFDPLEDVRDDEDGSN